MSNFPIKRAVKAGWDEMSHSYQRDVVISTNDVHFGPLIPGEREFRLLGDVKEKRVLELACGAAQNSIALSKWGACVTAVDLSSNQLDHARQLVNKEQVDVDLIQADIERLSMFVNESFDAIISSNGIEFIPDMLECLREWHRVLCVGGTLLLSTVHPLAAFEWDSRQSALIVGNYFNLPVEVWEDIAESDDQRGLTFFHTIEETFSALTSVGFAVERILEPPPYPVDRMNEAQKAEIPYYGLSWERDYERMSRVPFNVIYVARK